MPKFASILTEIVPNRVCKQKDKAKAEVDVQIIKRWILAALHNPPSFLLLNCIKHLNDSSSKIINARLKGGLFHAMNSFKT